MSAANIQTIRTVNQAFETGRLDAFLACCTPDVRWTLLGVGTWAGPDAIRAGWQCPTDETRLPRIAVDQIFADEADGAADGTVLMPRADGSYTTMHYCDVYRFRDGKVAELKSYCIEQPEAQVPSGDPEPA